MNYSTFPHDETKDVLYRSISLSCPIDTILFCNIGKNGLNSGFLQCYKSKSYFVTLAIILYFSNIIYSNILSLSLLTLKECILPLFTIMINCLAVILSLKVSNKKQAENIEKSRINTGFFPMFSNKKLSLGSNGTHGGRVNIGFGQRPDDFIVLADYALSPSVSPAGVCTSFRRRCICRVRTPTRVSKSRLAWSSFFWVFSKTCAKVSNSFLTPPSTCQTSALRFCTARVLKPICIELSSAAMVLGPAMLTL